MTDTHRIHGWHADTITPDWPALTVADLTTVLRRYPASAKSVQILWRSPRPFSAAARIRAGTQTLFVKRHHVSVRSLDALKEEHAFIAHLRHQGLPVPTLVPADDGTGAVQIGDWVYELHRPAPGIDLYRDAPSWTPPLATTHARSAGRMLAQLHQAAHGYTAPARSTALLVTGDTVLRAPDPLAALDAECQHRPGLASALEHRNWRSDLTPLLPALAALQPRLAAQPRRWTHGDWHVSNLFWSRQDAAADVSAILDFGLCAPTFALLDLATALERNTIAWLHADPATRPAFPDIAHALLSGYAEVLPLGPDDSALLADLLPLAHLDFALSELEYFHAVLHQPAMTDIVWRDFLLGHFAWFAWPQAQALLRLIRDFGHCTGHPTPMRPHAPAEDIGHP